MLTLFLSLAVVSAIHAAISARLAPNSRSPIIASSSSAGSSARYTIEMARSKVESVDVHQSFWGRIFNYGTILVRGTGGSLEPFRNIENPLQLRSSITAA